MMLMQYKLRKTLDLNETNYGGDPRNSSVNNVISQPEAVTTLRRWGLEVKSSSDVHMPHTRRSSLSHTESGARHDRIRPQRPSQTSMNIRHVNPHPAPRPTESEILISILESRGPVILFHHCGAFSYGPGHSPMTAGLHAVLITGVDTTRGVFYFNNPWGQTDVMTSIASIQGAIERWERTKPGPVFAYLR